MKDIKAKTLIKQLLDKNGETRLGGSYASLKANAFFEDLDWVYFFNLLVLFIKSIGFIVRKENK